MVIVGYLTILHTNIERMLSQDIVNDSMYVETKI